ncbi:unnamed protein product, partial [Closterium sp. NIES-54]
SLVSAVTTALTLACPDSGRIAVILDCQGAPALWHLPVGLLRATITALHRNFPHRMARLHVLHLPPALRLLARAMLQVRTGGGGGGGERGAVGGERGNANGGYCSKIQIIGGGSSSTSSLSDLFGLQVSVPARLAGSCICAVCCEGEAEGETGGGGGPRTEQRHGESGEEAGAAAQAGLAAGAEAARGASLSGPSDSLPLEHPCNGMIDSATCLSSPVLPSTPQQNSPQQSPPLHASPQQFSPMRPRSRSPLVCALRSDRGRAVSQGVEWAERRWVSRHVVWRMLLLLLMALTLTGLCLCSAAAMASYSYSTAGSVRVLLYS